MAFYAGFVCEVVNANTNISRWYIIFSLHVTVIVIGVTILQSKYQRICKIEAHLVIDMLL